MIMLHLVRGQAVWFEAITLGETTSAGVQSAAHSPSRRISSPRQDDFAKRPILRQLTQGFGRLAEGIDPVDDRFD